MKILLITLMLIACPAWAVDESSDSNRDVEISRPYHDAPELTVAQGVSRGMVRDFVMRSQESRLYPGLNGAYKRKVWVYLPPGFASGRPMPFMVVQDASWHEILPKILDNLIHERKVPAMVVVFVSSGGGDGKGSERGYEYDAVTERYAAFVETELLPRVSREFGVTFTKDPDGRATAGGSSGAACAFTMAWFHPELYHKVLSYSGTFVDQQSPFDPKSPHGAWEYHEHLIPAAERKPIRIWMEVGQNDNNFTRDKSGHHNWIEANRRMAKVLGEKGYDYHFVFAEGAGHVDKSVVRQTLPEAMVWLWRGYNGK